MEVRIACGSVVFDLSFFIKHLHNVQMFYEKDGVFRPDGGDINFRVRDRVSRVTVRYSSMRW
jgi:hypothetical protein